jgi:excisionase family DNA binding protein
MDTELLTAEQVAAKLGTNKVTILRWKREGVIPAEVDRGNFLRFDMDRVRQALREDAAKKVEA